MEEEQEREIIDYDRKFWTVYDGPSGRQLMRSRTEGFAAAWIDLHHEPWEYEPWRTKNGWLPDFWLPRARLLWDIKGGDITSEDKELIKDSARRGRDEKIAVAIWKPLGDRAWGRVDPDAKRFVARPFSAFLCAKCGFWTLGWYICQTCQTDTGFVLEHSGRNYVRDPSSFWGERDCVAATKFFRAETADIVAVEDLEDIEGIRPCGLPGERSFRRVSDASIYTPNDDEPADFSQVYYVKVEATDITGCL